MIITTPRVLAIRAPEGASTSTVLAPEHHDPAARKAMIAPERRDQPRDQVTDRPRIFIQTGTGRIAGLFEFIPFIHNGANSRARQQ